VASGERRVASQVRPRAAGYVLAGGASSRFGEDKGLVNLGGRPVLKHMIELVRSATPAVKIVGTPGKYAEFGIEVVRDRWPGEGPLGGIITALLATIEAGGRYDWNLILSCDMPFLTSDWLTYLLGRGLASSAQLVLASSAGGPEPLCACWGTEAAGILLPAFERGVRKVMDGAGYLKAEILDEKDWKRFDSSGRLFWNMNTQADYEQAKRILEAEQA